MAELAGQIGRKRDSSLWALLWNRPAKANRGAELNAAIKQLQTFVDARAGQLHALLSSAGVIGKDSPVDALTGTKMRRARRRALNRTIKCNCSAVLCACLAAMDLQTGAIGVREGGGLWRPLTVLEIDRRAFGDAIPGKRGIERTWRIMRLLRDAGLIAIEEIAVQTVHGFRAVAAFKHVCKPLADALGLASLLKQARVARDRLKGKRSGAVNASDIVAALGARQATPAPQQPARPAAAPPPATAPPERPKREDYVSAREWQDALFAHAFARL